MTGEDKYLSDRKARIQSLEKDVRAKTIGNNASLNDNKKEDKPGSELYGALENQWNQRKSQLLDTRKRVADLELRKLNKLSGD